MSKTPIEQNQTNAKPLTLNGETMGTRYSASFIPDQATDLTALEADLFEAVDLVDRQMTTWKASSDLMRLNAAEVGQDVPLPDALMEVLTTGLDIGRETNGAFDIGLGDLTGIWGFGALGKQPDAAAIRDNLGKARVPTHEVLSLDPDKRIARKSAPVSLDLSGIAKGYAVDRMVACLRRHKISNALASLDGELRAIGLQEDGKPWNVAVEMPDYDRRAAMSMLTLSDAAIATSGDYRHWIDVGNVRLAHTMSRLNGGPVQNKVASVSVLAKTCIEADAWATALLVMGPVAGLALARAKSMNALFVTRSPEGLEQMGAGPVFETG